MNYQRVYDEFITDRLLRQPTTRPYDVHHILPKCLEGKDEPENLIRLRHGDHLFAHILLAKIHGGPLLHSVIRMSGMARYRGRHSRARYDHLRQGVREAMLGNKYSVGVVHSEESRRALSEKLKGRKPPGYVRTPEWKEGQRQRAMGNKYGIGNRSMTGKTHSPAVIEAQRVRMLGNQRVKLAKERRSRDASAI